MSESYIPKALRDQVAAEAHYRCGYCLTVEEIVGTPIEFDHIIPESLGGLTNADNLWLACALCNAHKSNRIVALDPSTGEMTPLFDPRRQVWSEHFDWTSDGARIIGLTKTGRATVVGLQLNRSSLVAARRLWVAVGWHPPHDI